MVRFVQLEVTDIRHVDVTHKHTKQTNKQTNKNMMNTIQCNSIKMNGKPSPNDAVVPFLYSTTYDSNSFYPISIILSCLMILPVQPTGCVCEIDIHLDVLGELISYVNLL